MQYNSIQSDIHLTQVNHWEKAQLKDLQFKEQILLFEKAIRAVMERAHHTLSNITLTVVFDRVLHECKERYQMFSDVEINSDEVNFKKIIQNINNYETESLIAGHRYLLVELLRVLGRITADILTEPLHERLINVKWDENAPEVL